MWFELQLTNEVDAGFQRLGALLPLGGTNLTGVRSYELSGCNLANQLFGVTAYAVVLYLSDLDFAFGVNHKGTTIRHAFFFDEHAEAFSQHAEWVGQHGIVDLLDAV